VRANAQPHVDPAPPGNQQFAEVVVVGHEFGQPDRRALEEQQQSDGAADAEHPEHRGIDRDGSAVKPVELDVRGTDASDDQNVGKGREVVADRHRSCGRVDPRRRHQAQQQRRQETLRSHREAMERCAEAHRIRRRCGQHAAQQRSENPGDAHSIDRRIERHPVPQMHSRTEPVDGDAGRDDREDGEDDEERPLVQASEERVGSPAPEADVAARQQSRDEHAAADAPLRQRQHVERSAARGHQSADPERRGYAENQEEVVQSAGTAGAGDAFDTRGQHGDDGDRREERKSQRIEHRVVVELVLMDPRDVAGDQFRVRLRQVEASVGHLRHTRCQHQRGDQKPPVPHSQHVRYLRTPRRQPKATVRHRRPASESHDA
jgi:hypothetical protein